MAAATSTMSLLPPITQQQRWHAADSLVVLASRRHDSRRRRRCRYVVPRARLFGPAIFEASKLKVLFLGVDEEKHQHPGKLPRTYTLTHSDVTARLTLAVSHTINRAQLQGWYNKLQRDEVVAEWKKVQGHMSLHVHCHISGGHVLLDLIAGLRYYIFRKELPVVRSEGVRPRRRQPVQPAPGAGGGHGVGLLPLQPPPLQPRRVLGPAPRRRSAARGRRRRRRRGGRGGGGGADARGRRVAAAVPGAVRLLLPAIQPHPLAAPARRRRRRRPAAAVTAAPPRFVD
ncbi:protein STAY-GREEN, chloroplastic isoform X1 [Oryza glaberrima]|uniref:protein STAY-GREEN, chloroplastic isoform X1 n=1 Tax=Oryza glaberrima TaxID=4538 RepID=UPI00224C1FB3|nr:protein STAY-GREEN, chloroplastic isoform X1 [Oryza glaberrima]XP_052167007.1 protein STAY-GREEN, chloroplastic isoform X1 [Oryza glaberrima]